MFDLLIATVCPIDGLVTQPIHRLVSDDILRLVGPQARMVYVGKHSGFHTRTQVSTEQARTKHRALQFEAPKEVVCSLTCTQREVVITSDLQMLGCWTAPQMQNTGNHPHSFTQYARFTHVTA